MILDLETARARGLVETFHSVVNDEEVLLNTAMDDLVLLQDVDIEDLTKHLAAFRAEQRKWLLDLMLSRRGDVDIRDLSRNEEGPVFPDLIYALTGAFDEQPRANQGQLRNWRFLYIARQGNRPASALLRSFAPLENGTETTAVHNMTVADQRRYARAIFSPPPSETATRWLPVAEVADVLNITPASVTTKAYRSGWSRRDGNHGQRLVSVPIELLPPAESDFSSGAEAVIGLHSMAAGLKEKFAYEHAGLHLDDWLCKSHSASEFLERLNTTLLVETEEGREATRQRDRVPVMFLAYLNREGLVLLPQRVSRFYWNSLRGRPTHCFGDGMLEYWSQIAEVSRVAERTSFQATDLYRTLRGLRLTSTFATPDLLSDGLVARYKAVWSERNEVGMMANLAFDTTLAILGLSADRHDYRLKRPGDARKTDGGPFGWVKTRDVPGRSVAPPGYEPREDLFGWADFFTDALGLLKVKAISNFRDAAAVFLHYLTTLDAIPAGMEALSREQHIHDPSGINRTFRAWLTARYPADGARPNIKNALNRRTTILSKIASIFAAQIHAQGLDIANPIDMKRDKFKSGSKRRKTPRPAMEAEKLELIRKFNAKDDFAFSRAKKNHYRNVFDPETARFQDVWFPAYSLLIDLLLQLPFRSFQARYLDSGEGDELTFDPMTRTLVPNTGPLASRGRQESALCLVDIGIGPDDQTSTPRHVLGLRVNTNKTSEHTADQGWTVPWCPPGLEENLLRMRAWVSRYAPVKEPVKAKTESYLDEFHDEEVVALIPDTFPLFRDPARRDGQPLSRERLFAYWVELLTAVEEGYNKNRAPENRIALTKLRTDTTRAPIYDIHALRVSGITAMIDRGMPPDMVQEVVGHASMVMTLYYNKIRASRVYKELETYFRERGMDADAIGKVPFDDLASSLFNMRSAKDSIGLEMLKSKFGSGDKSWKVLSHGICPGGDCATGGRWYKNAHLPLRAGACSLCRYRVTGPRFLLGMVANANTLMFEMRRLGQEIAQLTKRRFDLEDQGESTVTIDGRLELARRSFDSAATEWSAEVQYIQAATELLNGMEQKASPEKPGTAGPAGSLMTPMDNRSFSARIEGRHEFHLLQSIAEGAELIVTEFRPGTREAIMDRDEWLNAVLDANGLDPLLIRLPREERLKAGNLLGQAFMALVPEDKLDGLRLGLESLDVAPALRVLCEEAAEQVRTARAINAENLFEVIRQRESEVAGLLPCA
ncbi:hypothetical protein DOO78_26175 [Roseicella frigidaeris]|uniref:Uncharacterized protein n=2 Tax=Roseicella frigidaeris TaxID=2230885 RepID=A0A327LXE7_9PROT|nr:hypothetical protein DOO78_26175 [Roseicella frigidaeris]